MCVCVGGGARIYNYNDNESTAGADASVEMPKLHNIISMQTQKVGNDRPCMIVVKNDRCQKFKSKINGCHQQSLAALFLALAATNSYSVLVQS